MNMMRSTPEVRNHIALQYHPQVLEAAMTNYSSVVLEHGQNGSRSLAIVSLMLSHNSQLP